MRFHVGPPPEDETFDPQTEGWLPIPGLAAGDYAQSGLAVPGKQPWRSR